MSAMIIGPQENSPSAAFADRVRRYPWRSCCYIGTCNCNFFDMIFSSDRSGEDLGWEGVIAIASVAGQAIQLGPETFMLFLAVISLGLGILNLLPVPILDGGYLLLLAVEGITGRPLGKRLQAVLFIGGVTIIIYLMLTATINDLTC